MDIEKYKSKSVCKLKKGFVMLGPEINNITYKNVKYFNEPNNSNNNVTDNKQLTSETLQKGLSNSSGPATIIINGKEYADYKNNEAVRLDLAVVLGSKGFTSEQVNKILDSEDAEQVQKMLKEGIDAFDETHATENRKDNVLLMDKDRYAKIDNFEKQEKLPENTVQDSFKKQFPQDDYPDLYKKDGSINERKAWNQFEDEVMFEAISGKSKADRIAELMQQGKSEAEAKKDVMAQNESFLKQEAIAQQKLNAGEELDEQAQKFIDARNGAHDFKKDAKQFSKNVQKVTERINNAIEKMNEWDWNKDLNNDQKEKIRNAVNKYNADQVANGGTPIDMFDENGNVPQEKKNLLYQFIMDQVTGTDAQVNKSAKKGNFFQKLFTKRNIEFSEKKASRDLGLNKKDIEKMGFDWENQISLGKTLLDGVGPAFLGAVFGAAVGKSDSAFDTDTQSDSQTATAKIDPQTISSSHSYSGAVDYMVNGEVVMQIPYSGVIDCVQEIAGKVVNKTATATATATAAASASVSAVLPAALIAGTTAMINSAVNQGINGQEKDIYNGNLYQVLSTKGEASLQNPDDVAKLSGLDPDKNTEEYNLARDIASYYFDEDGKTFHKQEFLADWQYNGGYNSKYLNTQEAAMWLQKLKERGPIKSNKINNNVIVSIPPEVLKAIAFDISGNGDLYPLQGSQAFRIDTYEGIGSDGEARDTVKMSNRGVNPEITEAQQKANVNKNRAQYVVASAPDGRIAVEPGITDVDGVTINNFEQPKTITMNDVTNGKKHIYKYELVDTETALKQWPSLKNEQGPFYKLVGVTDENGKAIVNPNKKDEVFSLNLVQPEPVIQRMTDETGKLVDVEIHRFEYNLYQNKNHPGSNNSSIDNRKGPDFWTRGR